MDPNSYSNFHQLRVTALHIDLTAHFDRKVLAGHVDLHCEAKVDDVSELVLDTRVLNIKRATLVGSDGDLKFELKESSEALGQALHISLPQALKNGTKVTVRVEYETTPESSAIQWLEPMQTAGKRHPYLFTQCQAIHARSLLPCQDAPSVKAPYTGTIRCPKPLVALMSAIPTTNSSTDQYNEYNFEQKVPMSSYLIAIAIGDLKSKQIGPRSRVWCEAETLDAAAWEFAETETFIATAEKLLIPYVWGTYDLLLLPPSFPYGGMENPCLTFVTPTLLAGDRSLANVVAHEIAHSWSGNLVSPSTWEHFWLNEGFTMYIQRRILARMDPDPVHGELEQEFDARLGYNDLADSVNLYGETHEFTKLVPKLQGVDPDDAFSSVPYEKGFNLLYYLMKLVGGHAKFDAFLKSYFDHFKYQCITSDNMKDYFLSYFSGSVDKSVLDSIEWDKWFYAPGMPVVPPKFDTTLADESTKLAERWAKHNGEGATENDIKNWSTKQRVFFLETLAESAPLPHETLDKMDQLYSLSSVANAEVRFSWQNLCVKSNYVKIYPHVVAFLKEQGRMKFVRPLYRNLNKAEGGAELAKETFLKNRSLYHNIASKMIAKDLGL